MPRLDVTIKTRDGICPASVFTPADTTGPWPAVIFFMDGFGIRPAMREMGQRLADGGNLATTQPDSPHLFLRNVTGRVYVAGAIEDESFPEEQRNRLEQALTKAGVDHLVETYSGARHGFAVPDVPGFDLTAAERHWAALFKLLSETFARKI